MLYIKPVQRKHDSLTVFVEGVPKSAIVRLRINDSKLTVYQNPYTFIGLLEKTLYVISGEYAQNGNVIDIPMIEICTTKVTDDTRALSITRGEKIETPTKTVKSMVNTMDLETSPQPNKIPDELNISVTFGEVYNDGVLV